jgi:adenylate kinase family enzyme
MIKNKKNIIFLGAPGTGKGTISAELNKIIDSNCIII